MIAFKSFPLEKIEEMNEFMKTHPPLPTKEGMAVTFQGGYAVMWYEDGKFDSAIHWKSTLNHSIVELEYKLIQHRIDLDTNADELYKIIPKKDYEGKTANELIEFFKAKGLKHKQSEEMCKLVADLDQKRWLAEKSIYQAEMVVLPRLRGLLANYSK